MTNYKDAKYQFPTSSITSGTFADARISEASVTQHVTATDLQPLKSDLSALALREATNESSAAFNLPNQFIDTFATDVLATKTTVSLSDGCVKTVVAGTGDNANILFMGHMNDVGLTDSSSHGWTTTLNGGCSRSSTESKFGGYSAYSTGGTGGTMYTGSWGTELTTENWTVDFWAKNASTSQGGANRVFSLGNGSMPGGSGTGPTFSYSWSGGGSTNFNLYNEYADPDINPTPASGCTLNTDWNHWAWMRDGRDIHWYQNGNHQGSYTNMFDASGTGATMNNGSYSLGIFGRGGSTGEIFNAYIDEFRVSKIQQYTPSANFTPETSAYTASSTSATGTAIQAANAVGSAKTKVGGTMLYKDNEGTATLGTDLIIYFTCDGGSNWTEASSYSAITPVYSTGIKQVRVGETTCTSGTDVRYKAVWANQADGSKETQLHGIGVNY